MKKDRMIDAISNIDQEYLIEYAQYETKLGMLQSKKKTRSVLICVACLVLAACFLLISLPLSLVMLDSEPVQEIVSPVIESVLFPLDQQPDIPDDPDASTEPHTEKLMLNWIEWIITEKAFEALEAGTENSKIEVFQSADDGLLSEYVRKLGDLLERMYDYYLRHKKEIDEIIELPESSEDTTDFEQTTYPDEETTVPDEDTTEGITDDTTTEPDEQTTPPEPRDYTDQQNVMYRTSPDGTFWIVLGRTDDAKQQNDKFSLVIPENIAGIPVKEIQAYAFYEEKELVSLELPEGLEIIGEWAFSDTSIAELVLPATLTDMGELSFSHNKNLRSVKVLGGITELPHGVFFHCIKLEQVYLHEDIEVIGSSSFASCPLITQINLPEGLKIIENDAFNGTRALINIQIPLSVEYIGSFAFAESGALGWMDMVESGNYDIDQYDAVQLTVPEGVTTLYDYTFYCSGIEKITIPGSVTEIRMCAFANCYLLQEIEYQGTVEEWNAITLDANAFCVIPIVYGNLVPDFPLNEIRVVCTNGEILIQQEITQ